MNLEARQLSPKYDFEFAGGQFNSYLFETTHKIIYEVTFKPSPYLFDEFDSFKNETFEFSILVVENPTGKTPPSDSLIPNTIATIFSHFFAKKQTIVVYICETTDFRAAARARKFNRWFDWYKGTSFVKIDMQMGRDSNGETYFTSMILRLDNPEIGEIVTAFRNLIISNIK